MKQKQAQRAVGTQQTWHELGKQMSLHESTRLGEQNALGEGGVMAEPSEVSSQVPLQRKWNGLTEVENSANKSAIEGKDQGEQEGDAAVVVALQRMRKMRVRGCRADGHRVFDGQTTTGAHLAPATGTDRIIEHPLKLPVAQCRGAAAAEDALCPCIHTIKHAGLCLRWMMRVDGVGACVRAHTCKRWVLHAPISPVDNGSSSSGMVTDWRDDERSINNNSV
jgi:hypothetical protein